MDGYIIGYEQALLDAARNIKSPEKRAEVGDNLGWETALDVVNKMIIEMRNEG